MLCNSFYIRLGSHNLAAADLTDYYGKGKIITRLSVPKSYQGFGHGSALLRQICAEADATRTKLWLEISPSGPLDAADLEAWYTRYGFTGNRTGVMQRLPKL